ncbi:tetratricopeptide repeat-containing sensor histidine kinase [Algoriphagus sp.]|uniref:tetratricopeptide repeat-containing sensor histidine kinase n=1 Tax=Algoriphagus sp. TaxID=1872435 RepID=UPI0025DC0B23|nr:tetratricopeptide repeat-containing sensor histidine kinase [Algoriphagus sp.]
MLRTFTLFLAIFLVITFSYSQSLRDRLGRTVLNPDSALIIFELEKKNLQTSSDSGLYFYFIADRFYSESEYDSAEYYFQKSINLLDPIAETSIRSMAFISLSRINSFAGNWEKALSISQEHYNHALSALDSNYMAFALFDISVIYHDMEQFDKGVTYGKEALELLENYPKAIPLFRAYALNAIAINFDDWDKPDSALFYHYQVIDDLENLDSMRVSNTFNNIGNTLLKQKNYSEAKKWMDISLSLNTKGKSNTRIATNYTNLATIAYSLGNYIEAEMMLDSAAKYVELSKSIEKNRDFLQEQYRYNKLRGRLVLAIDYLEEYSALKDSIFKEERVKLMADLETKYKVETKERELAESRAALAENELLIKNRNNQLLLAIIFSISILGLAFFIYYRQKTRNRHLEQEAKLQAIYAEKETQKRLHEQRDRISSDLHDNIGAQLTFIVYSLNNLKSMEHSPKEIASKIDQISSFTVETVGELRDTIWAMNKDHVSLEDLQGRLANFLARAKNSCPEIEFELKVDQNLDEEFLLNSFEGINYFRVAQEAINNAIKHSNATKITIDFLKDRNSIRICVKDDGKGIQTSKPGNGLSNMQNRADRIGKNLVINTEENQGTQICIY